jgi:CRP-like cAMP-binding protein
VSPHDNAPAPGPSASPNAFPAAFFRELFAGCRPERLDAGQALFIQGDPGDRIFGVLSGKLEISLLAVDGRKLVANIETADSLVGEIAALDGGPRSASVTCLSDCSVVSLSRAQMLDRLDRSPTLSHAVIAHLCARLRWMSDEVGDQALLTLDRRLAKRVLLLAGILAEPTGWIVVSQQEIAEFLGATRESVNKSLSEWRSSGLVEVGRNRLRVIDPHGLRRIAEGR